MARSAVTEDVIGRIAGDIAVLHIRMNRARRPGNGAILRLRHDDLLAQMHRAVRVREGLICEAVKRDILDDVYEALRR